MQKMFNDSLWEIMLNSADFSNEASQNVLSI